MATKKQKRAEGERKQAINRAESVRSGLAAQKRAREHRDKLAKDAARRIEREQNRKKANGIIAEMAGGDFDAVD